MVWFSDAISFNPDLPFLFDFDQVFFASGMPLLGIG